MLSQAKPRNYVAWAMNIDCRLFENTIQKISKQTCRSWKWKTRREKITKICKGGKKEQRNEQKNLWNSRI